MSRIDAAMTDTEPAADDQGHIVRQAGVGIDAIPKAARVVIYDAAGVIITDTTANALKALLVDPAGNTIVRQKVPTVFDQDFGVVVLPVLPKDSFGRLRTSEPQAVFDSTFQYDKQPILWNEGLTGGGTATHVPAHSAVDLVVSSDGDEVIRQTRSYHRYQPGKSQLILTTFVMDGTVASMVRRTKTSGSVVPNSVAQASWNIDHMDGTGPSGDTLDFTKGQVFFIDLEWLSLGDVLCGFVIDREMVPAHLFRNVNNLAVPYMTTANLPVRYEITHTGGNARERVGYFNADNGIYFETTGGTGTLKQDCCSVMSEGGVENESGFPSSASTGIVGRVTVGTTEIPLLSIRLAATFNGIANQMKISKLFAAVTGQTKDIHFRVRHNATLTGASFAAVDAGESGMEFDLAATATSGGHVHDELTIVGTGGGGRGSGRPFGELEKVPMGFDLDGSSNPDTITVTGEAAAASAIATASYMWVENR